MRAAIISVHGVRVGQLDRVSVDEDYIFHFDRGWLEDPARPPLGQFFLDRMPDEIHTSGLPAWFSNLLPQGPARRLMQRWARLDEEDDDAFALLVAMGKDLPGAVTVSAAAQRQLGPGEYLRMTKPAGTPGFSLPGVQCKLSVKRGERGLVVPIWGETGEYVAKFHDPQYPGLPRLEHATTEWARLAGLQVHQAMLVRADAFYGRG